MLERTDGWGAPSIGRVLIVDDDRDIGDLVHAILTDEGFAVSLLHHQTPDAIRVSVNQLEPDCILLDGASPEEYGPSWAEAAWLSHRDRPVPVVMFTAHRAAMDEAEANESERSREAGFSAILPKPFDIDQLLDAVGQAVGSARPFDGTEVGDHERTATLVRRLEQAGATEIHASTRREWASFTTPTGAFLQVYWWQRDGVYYLVRFAQTGGKIGPVGRFYDLGAAISVAMTLDNQSVRDGARAEPIPRDGAMVDGHAGAAVCAGSYQMAAE
jgi:DNA-binding response OmpR family regulator